MATGSVFSQTTLFNKTSAKLPHHFSTPPKYRQQVLTARSPTSQTLTHSTQSSPDLLGSYLSHTFRHSGTSGSPCAPALCCQISRRRESTERPWGWMYRGQGPSEKGATPNCCSSVFWRKKRHRTSQKVIYIYQRSFLNNEQEKDLAVLCLEEIWRKTMLSNKWEKYNEPQLHLQLN